MEGWNVLSVYYDTFAPVDHQRLVNDSSEVSHQILDVVLVKVSAALRETIQQDFDQTLVPGRAHGQKTVLQQHRTQKQPGSLLLSQTQDGGFTTVNEGVFWT